MEIRLLECQKNGPQKRSKEQKKKKKDYQIEKLNTSNRVLVIEPLQHYFNFIA